MLVFEDLHWADDALLEFLERLADRAEGVPLLIVCTARPELYERRPDYTAGLRNTNSINLAPLSSEETARLVSALLDTSVIPAELQQPIRLYINNSQPPSQYRLNAVARRPAYKACRACAIITDITLFVGHFLSVPFFRAPRGKTVHKEDRHVPCCRRQNVAF